MDGFSYKTTDTFISLHTTTSDPWTGITERGGREGGREGGRALVFACLYISHGYSINAGTGISIVT